jgi:exportin-2 (importin alpha re-exporter)
MIVVSLRLFLLLCRDDLKPYFKVLLVTLLTRMQTSKTDKFVYLFALFVMFSMAINVDGLSPDYVINTVEDIQPQCVQMFSQSFVVPDLIWSI